LPGKRKTTCMGCLFFMVKDNCVGME